jgi:hypothetical protein
LQRLFDAHPQLAVTPETHWIVRFHKKLTHKGREALVTPRFVPKMFAYHRFPEMGLSREQIQRLFDDDGVVPYARFVSKVFALYGAARGKELVGDKTPGYARHVPLLHELFPGARFVHLIRDGRDVCLSAIDWRRPGKLLACASSWREDPVTTAALWWNWHVRMARESGRELGPSLYCELRYESLVAAPADECARLCAFLGLRYSDLMLRFHEGRTRHEPGLDSKDAWLPVTAGLRDWRTQMAPVDLERFEAAAGEVLDELGYPCASQEPSAEACERAARLREAFARERRTRGESLPKRW